MASVGFITGALFVVCALLCISEGKQVIRLRHGLECPMPGYYRDEVDCRRFYYCLGASSSEKLNLDDPAESEAIKEFHNGFECPEGTIFDEMLGRCNHPHLVQNLAPECKTPQLSESHSEIKTGTVPEIVNN